MALDGVAKEVITEETGCHGGEVVRDDVCIDNDGFGDGERGSWIDCIASVALHQLTSRQNCPAKLTRHLGFLAVELKVGLHADLADLKTALALAARTHTAADLFVSLNRL